MLTRTLRNSMRHREGQALVLAAVMVLVVTLAVVTTINVGHTIHERVRLQNTADAAAFSMAAMEARAFNFYAFSNRTQVSHYVSAMKWMSVNSMLYGMEAMLTDLFGMFASIVPDCKSPGLSFWIVACPILKAIPYVGVVITVLEGLIEAFRVAVAGLQLALESPFHSVDETLGKKAVPSFRGLNRVMGGMSAAMLASVHQQLRQTTKQVIEDNDPNLNSSVSEVLTGPLTECLFNRAHNPDTMADLQSGARAIDPTALGDTNGRALAKRAMGQISNASRFACDGPTDCVQGLITRRTISQMLSLPSSLNALTDLLEQFEENSLEDGDSLFQVGKLGQTKMLSHAWADGRGNNRIRDWKELPDQGYSIFAQGDNLGADDLYWVKVGGPTIAGLDNPFSCKDTDDPLECHGDPRKGKGDDPSAQRPFGQMFKPSIWALNPAEGTHADGGIHYRVVKRTGLDDAPGIDGMRPSPAGNKYESIGINEFTKAGVITIYVANIRGVEDGNHPWGGLAPFPHFEPGLYDTDCPSGGPSVNREHVAERQTMSEGDYTTRNAEFNQPSTWVVLNKQPAEMRNPISDPTGAGSNAPALLNDEGKMNVRLFGGPGVDLVLEDDRVEMSGLNFSVGINAIARGQTYYHRPGNWNEQPNFFNPYWRPRLAPVQQGLYSFPMLRQLVSQLPGPFRDASHRIVTH